MTDIVDLLDPELREFVRRVESAKPGAAAGGTPEEQRVLYRELAASFQAPRPERIRVDDYLVATPAARVPVRVYRPAHDDALPTLVYFHGGGWVVGDLDTHDSITAEIAAQAVVNVVVVDYRLAPEHRYPAAFDDAREVVAALRGEARRYGIDNPDFAVGGDSAGGNLAAAVCLHARDRDGPELKAQILIYPALAGDVNLPAHTENAHAPLLSLADMQAYYRHYADDRFPSDDPYLAPLEATDLSGLPPAFVITAQYDPLRDDGVRYAERLRAASVPCELFDGAGLIHGFLRARHMSGVAGNAMTRICDATARLLHDP